MNGWKQSLMVGALAAAPVLAQPAPNYFPQIAPIPQMPQIDIVPQDLDAIMARANAGLARANAGLAVAQAMMGRSGMPFQSRNAARTDAEYDGGTRALDDHKYEDAIRHFDEVINGKSPSAARARDGALYWKAYALNRLGRRDEALAALAVLRGDYPKSRWLNEAQVLEAEVKQGSGKPVSPAQETNEDLKLMAINGLMNADPDRALPLLEGILKGSSAPKVKDRALFVLTQNQSPRAQQILTQYAKGAGNPDLQMRAIRYIGMSGSSEAMQQLEGIYKASIDAEVKRQIMQSLMMSNGSDALLSIAKNEKDAELRGHAIQQLGVMRAGEPLSQLYATETSEENKVHILRSLFMAGAADKLLGIARTEKNPRLRDEAIRSLAMTQSASPESLAGLYAAQTDTKAKRQLVDGLFAGGNAKPMIELARKETDPEMKRYIVQRLSMMHSKEATDFMMELLK